MSEMRLVAAPVTVQDDRASDDGKTPSVLEGYGAVFDQETVIAGLFREKVERGAFRDSLREDDHVVSFNHSPDWILGRRSAGTVRVTEDATGLHYAVAINPADPLALSVAARVRRRDIRGSSFQFVLAPEDEVWTMTPGNALPLRTILKARVIELGPVSYPAYPQTSVVARAQQSIVERT